MEVDPETEEEVNSRTAPAGASELEMELHETPNVLRDATANKVDDGERDLNETFYLWMSAQMRLEKIRMKLMNQTFKKSIINN